MNLRMRIRELNALMKEKTLDRKLPNSKLNSYQLKCIPTKKTPYPLADIFMVSSAITIILLCIYFEIAVTPVPYLFWGLAAFAAFSLLFLGPPLYYYFRVRNNYTEISHSVDTSKILLTDKTGRQQTLNTDTIVSITFSHPTFSLENHYITLIKKEDGTTHHILCDITTDDFTYFLDHAFLIITNLKA